MEEDKNVNEEGRGMFPFDGRQTKVQTKFGLLLMLLSAMESVGVFYLIGTEGVLEPLGTRFQMIGFIGVIIGLIYIWEARG